MLLIRQPRILLPQTTAQAARIPGLRHLWNFADKSGACLITGQRLTLATSASYEPDGTLFSPSSSNGGVPTTLPLSFHAGGPIGIVIASRRTLGTVNWSLMNPNWDGWYETDGTILSTNNTDFSGSVAPTAGNADALPIRATAMTMSGANDLRASIGGGPVASDTSCAAPTPDNPNSTFRIGTDGASTNGANVYVSFVALFDRSLSDDELIRYSAQPASTLFEPRRIWVPVSAPAGGTHTTTGALAADVAVVAGTAAHLTLHTTTGALAADAATVSGSATHLTLHTTTGALSAAAATVSGAAVHPHTTAGALAAQDAAVSGAADNAAGGTHSTTGALASDAAIVAGTAAHLTLHTTTGALSADAATVAGTAAHLTLHTSTGVLTAGAAEVAGAAAGPGASAPVATSGGGIIRKPHRYDYLNPPTRERLAVLARQQREAMGILPKTAQKRVEAAAKKAARKPEPAIQALAPVVAQVAQETQAPAVDVMRAVEAAFQHQRALVEAKYAADMARRAEDRAAQAEQHRVQAIEREEARQKHLQRLRAEDEVLLQGAMQARQQAIQTIRGVQKALLALIGR